MKYINEVNGFEIVKLGLSMELLYDITSALLAVFVFFFYFGRNYFQLFSMKSLVEDMYVPSTSQRNVFVSLFRDAQVNIDDHDTTYHCPLGVTAETPPL